MTRSEVAAELGCGMQQWWVWRSGGQPVALVLNETRNPALPDRVCVGDGEYTRSQALGVDGMTLPVFSHDGEGVYRRIGDRALALDDGATGKAQAAQDAPERLRREGSLFGVLHLRG